MAIRNWSGILLHAHGMLLSPKHIYLSHLTFFRLSFRWSSFIILARRPVFVSSNMLLPPERERGHESPSNRMQYYYTGLQRTFIICVLHAATREATSHPAIECNCLMNAAVVLCQLRMKRVHSADTPFLAKFVIL
jgi:hypothetical protein